MAPVDVEDGQIDQWEGAVGVWQRRLGYTGSCMAKAWYVYYTRTISWLHVNNCASLLKDLLILGLGPHTYPITRETREHISSLGIRVDIQDTRNAAAQFNLLATERGIENVAAALLPMGWRDHP